MWCGSWKIERTLEQRLLQSNSILSKFVNVVLTVVCFEGWVLGSHITTFSGYHLVCDLSCYSEGDFRLKLGSLTVVIQTSLSELQIRLQNKSVGEHISKMRLFISSTITVCMVGSF